MDRMRAAFEVNTLGTLRVQQALAKQMRSPGGKVVVISTGFGSINDNTSGGTYAYRTSKAGVNMIAKTMSCDFKADGISVSAIAPGFLLTEFGPGKEKLSRMGAAPVEGAVSKIVSVIDQMSLDNTGSFVMVPTSGDDPKPMPW